MVLVGSGRRKSRIWICTLSSRSSGIESTGLILTRTPGRSLRRTVSNSQSQILGGLLFLLEPAGLILIDLMVRKILITVLLMYLNLQMTSRPVRTLGFMRATTLMNIQEQEDVTVGRKGKHRRVPRPKRMI